mgnify:CR=1 FL=1
MAEYIERDCLIDMTDETDGRNHSCRRRFAGEAWKLGVDARGL